MAEAEDQDVNCPGCRRKEVHFDREIGFYCAGCDRQFSGEEAEAFVEDQISRHR